MPAELSRRKHAAALLSGVQRQADRVDAVAQVGRGVVALTLEDVAEVGVAVGAAHLDAWPAGQRPVLDVADAILGERLEEARPTAMRVELGGAAEQFGVAGPAAVDTLGLGVGVFADKGRLGARFPQDVELPGAELDPPLLVGQSELPSPRQ